MKMIGLFSLVGVLCLAAPPLVHGKTSSQPSTRFDVTVVGKMPRVSGGLNDVFITFSMPVEVPNATLASGSYVFTKMAEPIVRVTSTDRKTVYATFMTVLALRYNDIGRAQVRFQRDAPAEPLRILAVYPQGSSTGYAPVYARRQQGD